MMFRFPLAWPSRSNDFQAVLNLTRYRSIHTDIIWSKIVCYDINKQSISIIYHFSNLYMNKLFVEMESFFLIQVLINFKKNVFLILLLKNAMLRYEWSKWIQFWLRTFIKLSWFLILFWGLHHFASSIYFKAYCLQIGQRFSSLNHSIIHSSW